jgi:two-component system, chemotaxis family, protein-glutamate methylesterase/glutaminase
MGTLIKAVVVDDSAFMRKSISMMLESDPDIKVVATARNGREGIEKIKEFAPDIVTMDVEMPEMDGLTALGILMKENPVPVLMVSSLTTDGASTTLEALNLGAVDFIPKDLSYVSVDIVKIREELIAKVKEITRSRGLQFRLRRIKSASQKPDQRQPRAPSQSFVKSAARPQGGYRGIVLGISTGGPFALLQTIPKLPANLPLGIAIVQHMPAGFTRSMADRLNSLSEVEVKEAESGETLRAGTVLIAPGGKQMTLVKAGRALEVRVSDEPRNTLYRPCADVMFTSAAEQCDGALLGVIMTGMGKDGLEGLKLIKRRGGYVIAQDEDSCVVYGMPRAAVEEGLADAVVPLDDIASTIVGVLSKG